MVFTTNRALHSRDVSILMKRLTLIMNVEFQRNVGKCCRSRLDTDEMALVGWVISVTRVTDELSPPLVRQFA